MTTVVTPPAIPDPATPATTPVPAASGPELHAERPQPREVSEFAKRRHALSAKAEALKVRERAADQRVKDAEARVAAAEKSAAEERTKREAWEKSPMAAAKAAGRDLNEVIREGIAESTPERLADDARAEVKRLRDEIAAKERSQQEATEKQRLAAEQQQT